MKKLLKWFQNLIKKHPKTSELSLGVVVEITANYTCRGYQGVIVDHEHTDYPSVQLYDEVYSPMRFLRDEIKIVDRSHAFGRPRSGVAIDQLIEFAKFCNQNLNTFPKFILVSPLTLKHLAREGMRTGTTWYTSPTLVDVGECPVLTELVVRGIPIIDRLPVHMSAKNFEIPHFVAGLGLENGVYYLTGLLNPPVNVAVEVAKRSTQQQTDFNSLALGRKSKARWNV